MLARNVNYEIPALKRQIAKCQQMQQVCIFSPQSEPTLNCWICLFISWSQRQYQFIFLQDCVRREGEYVKNAAELRDKFHSSCVQMGIEVNGRHGTIFPILFSHLSYTEMARSSHKKYHSRFANRIVDITQNWLGKHVYHGIYRNCLTIKRYLTYARQRGYSWLFL